MLIYLIILTVSVGLFIAWLIARKRLGWISTVPDWLLMLSALFGIVLLVLSLIIVGEHIDQDAKRRQFELRREAIIWQMENGQYLSGDLGDFNADVYKQKWLHENPWFSWFVGDYIMDIELIDTNK